MAHVATRLREYFRLTGKLYYTEDGAYKEIPDNMTAAYIEVEAVYLIVLGTDAGEFQLQSFANMPAMDKNKTIGGPVTFAGNTLYVEPGPGTVALELTQAYNPYLAAGTVSLFDSYWATLVKREPNWYK